MVELIKEHDGSDGWIVWRMEPDVRLEDLLDAIHKLGLQIEDVNIGTDGGPLYVTLDARQ